MRIPFEENLNKLSRQELIELLMEEKLTNYFTKRNTEKVNKTLGKLTVSIKEKERIISDLRKMISIQDEVITMKNDELVNIKSPLFRAN